MSDTTKIFKVVLARVVIGCAARLRTTARLRCGHLHESIVRAGDASWCVVLLVDSSGRWQKN